ncbi:MAG TPA: T9SS type A sorting domain-containing protein, partial [Chryseosolibacter sp.]|nr:T9SS type A sorting domain-containing protein [Chryseosolibacter sp.]
KGQTILASLGVPNTGGAQVWQTISTTLQLGAGSQKFRVACTATGFSLNWMAFEQATQAMMAMSSSETSDDILLYPNPACNFVNISAANQEPIREVLIATQSGIIRTLKPEAAQVTFSTAELQKGMYIIKVRTSTTFEVKKLLIE